MDDLFFMQGNDELSAFIERFVRVLLPQAVVVQAVFCEGVNIGMCAVAPCDRNERLPTVERDGKLSFKDIEPAVQEYPTFQPPEGELAA